MTDPLHITYERAREAHAALRELCGVLAWRHLDVLGRFVEEAAERERGLEESLRMVVARDDDGWADMSAGRRMEGHGDNLRTDSATDREGL